MKTNNDLRVSKFSKSRTPSSHPLFFTGPTGEETSGNKGAFFPAASGADVRIYYSKHQSCIFLLFSGELNFSVHNVALCNGAKNVKCCFPDFLGTFMCCTIKQDSGQSARSLGSERRFFLQSGAPV